MEDKICQVCNKIINYTIKIGKLAWNKRKFCSLQCKRLAWKPYNKGSTSWNKNKKMTNSTRVKMSQSKTREKHPNWKNGKTAKNQVERNRPQYKKWVFKIYQRDQFTCQFPGCKQKKEKINAHHIKTWAKYPELRFSIENGITLCVKCHKRVTWKEEQYEKLFLEILISGRSRSAL